MGTSARLHSAEALQDFRGRLDEFRLEVIEALAAADASLQQIVDWLEQQQKHWRHESQKRSELMIRARRELEERRHSNARDHRGCTEQEIAYRKARQRLEEADDKAQRCRTWLRQLPQYRIEYDAPARMLSGMMETEVLRALALLRQKIEVLEQYTTMRAGLESSDVSDKPSSPLEPGAAGTEATSANEPTSVPVLPE
jgi:hypothetical protein